MSQKKGGLVGQRRVAGIGKERKEMEVIKSGYDHNTLCTYIYTIIKMLLNLRNQIRKLNWKLNHMIEINWTWV